MHPGGRSGRRSPPDTVAMTVPSPALTPLTTWTQAALVSVGGVAGCLARWRMGVWLNTLPWPIAAGTLAVNVIGGLVVGFMLVVLARTPSDATRLLVVTGFLGGMTTFSAFTAESLGLLIKGQVGIAVMHSLVHVFGALLAATLGWTIGRWLLG